LLPKAWAIPFDKLGHGSISKELKPFAFAIAPEKETTGVEAGLLPTLRLGFKGSREMLCMQAKALMEHIAKDNEGRTLPTIKQASTWLRDASAEKVNQIIDGGPGNMSFRCTVGPQDMLLLPAGWAFSERVKGNVDYHGLRYQFLHLGDLALMEFFNNTAIAQGKPNETLQHAIDFLTLYEEES
jgi:hypothetical protein